MPPPRSLFHLNDDKKFEEDMRNAGFVNVKTFFAPCNECFNKPDKMWGYFLRSPSYSKLLNPLNEEELEKARTTFFTMFEERFGSSTGNVVTFELLVVVGTKP